MPSYTESTYIVFGNLPEDLVDPIDAIRKIHNPSAVGRWKAHITVKQDEDYIDKEGQLLEVIKQHFSNSPKIPCILGSSKIKKISEEKYMVYIPVISKELNNFVSSLSKTVEPLVSSISEDALQSTHWEQSKDFFGHITISSNIKTLSFAKEIADLLDKKLENFHEIFEISSLSLCKWKNNKWNEVSNITK